MHLGLQTKLFLLLSGLTAAVLAGLLVALNVLLTDRLREAVMNDFRETQVQMALVQRLHYDRLVESAVLIREHSTFKAAVSTHDPATVAFSVEEFALFVKTDLFVVTSREGKVLAHLGTTMRRSDDIGNLHTIREAMAGNDPPEQVLWPDLWAISGRVYQVVSVPIFAGDMIIGTLTLGARLTHVEAAMLKGTSKVALTFFLGSVPFAASDSTLDSASGRRFAREQAARIRAMASNLEVAEPFEAVYRGEQVFAFMSPLGRGAPAFFLATVPKAQGLALLTSMQRRILWYGLFSLMAAMALAIWLGRAGSAPIRNLAQALRRVQEGDLSMRVRPGGSDEVGDLGRAYNAMVAGLRERMHLERYVGAHTVEMIRGTGTEVPALGGARRELAVLFSDVRGFTAFSEARPPEEVVDSLNRILSAQARIVHAHGGFVDKFVGDEMVALFDGDTALDRAIRCAEEIQQALGPMEGRGVQGVGIGLNYGTMVLGNMGATDRMDYTVVGAAVNLCARLCAVAGPGQILIPRAALGAASPDVRTGARQLMSLKGLSTPVEVVEIRYDHQMAE